MLPYPAAILHSINHRLEALDAPSRLTAFNRAPAVVLRPVWHTGC